MMTRTHRFLALSVAVASGLVACSDSTGPADRSLTTLWNLETPASVEPLDTVRVAFTYAGGMCGPPPQLDVSVRPARIVIAAWVARSDEDRVCVAGAHLAGIMPSRAEMAFHPLQFGGEDIEVVFRQPGGVDSVRTIVATVNDAAGR